jgi:hypothetical protein
MEALLDRQRGAAAGRSLRAAGRRVLTVTNVATPSKPPSARLAKRSKVELIKEESDYLRHPLMQELVDEKTYISEDAVQLMKFHGSYMQDHREKRAFGTGKFYQFMMRTRQPSGLVTNQLYLVMDDLADQVGTLQAGLSAGRAGAAAAGRRAVPPLRQAPLRLGDGRQRAAGCCGRCRGGAGEGAPVAARSAPPAPRGRRLAGLAGVRDPFRPRPLTTPLPCPSPRSTATAR